MPCANRFVCKLNFQGVFMKSLRNGSLAHLKINSVRTCLMAPIVAAALLACGQDPMEAGKAFMRAYPVFTPIH